MKLRCKKNSVLCCDLSICFSSFAQSSYVALFDHFVALHCEKTVFPHTILRSSCATKVRMNGFYCHKNSLQDKEHSPSD